MIKLFVFFLFTLPLLVIDPPIFAFIMIGMFPAFTAMMVDRSPERSRGMTVAFFNMAGAVKFLEPMLERIGSNKFPEALNLVNLMVVYIFASVGYFIVWLVPRLFVIYADYKNQNRARIISEKLANLVEEWGAEVRQ